jgi:hypothetical protein
MEIKVSFEHWAFIFEWSTSTQGKKVLTVCESELDSQAQVEYFQTFDWPLSLYPFQVKVKLY